METVDVMLLNFYPMNYYQKRPEGTTCMKMLKLTDPANHDVMVMVDSITILRTPADTGRGTEILTTGGVQRVKESKDEIRRQVEAS